MTQATHTIRTEQLRSVLLRWTVLLIAAGAFALWTTCRMTSAANDASAQTHKVAQAANHPNVKTVWTCSMHPQIRRDEPGKCPICGMALIKSEETTEVVPTPAGPKTEPASPGKAWYRCTMPECGDQGSDDPNSRCPVCGMKRERVDTHGGNAGEFEITLGERARRLAEVETQPATKRLLTRNIRTVGRVGYDETRLKMVSAWIDGRIDKLFADFTGMSVQKGDHLLEIYSPQLFAAQEEFLQAARMSEARGTPSGDGVRRTLVVSARRKLELLGLTEGQINAIEHSGEATTHLVTHAPIGGTIVDRRAMEGMYVRTGDVLYTIADLTHLWVLVQLFESDLPWVKPFQEVEITTQSLPGQTFRGQIMFIEPTLNSKTRTVDVRIHVSNPDLRLKPEMWVTANIKSALAEGGRGAIPPPTGAFACPMHPWETSDEPGRCPVCDMDRVASSTLASHAPPTEPVPLLSVPRGAVMQTGERAIVYAETSPGTYRGAEVRVGPLAEAEDRGEFYPVLSGIAEGDAVVTRGNFAIDSQMQLAGKPSLFSTRSVDATQDDPAEENGSPRADAEPSDPNVQTRCPVMGGAIEKDVFTDYRGVRIYFCCPPCIEDFRADPNAYLENLPSGIRKKSEAGTTEENSDD